MFSTNSILRARRTVFPIATTFVLLLGLLWGFTVLNAIWFLLGPLIALMLALDTRTTGIVLIAAGTLWMPTFVLDGIALKPDHIFTLIGTSALVFWLLRDLPKKINVPLIALVPLALLLLQITPGWGEVWDLFFAWGRTLSLVALALALAAVRSNPESRRVGSNLFYFLVLFPGISPILQAVQILPIQPMAISEGLRYGGLLGHPTWAGYTIVLIIAFLCFDFWKRIPRTAATFFLQTNALMLLVVSVILGAGFGAFVLATVTLTYWVIVGIVSSLRFGAEGLGLMTRVLPALAGLGGSVSALFWNGATLRNRFSGEFLTGEELASRAHDLEAEKLQIPFWSLTWREAHWQKLLAGESPYHWFGSGAKTSDFPHSGYLQTYVEFGWFGVLVALCAVMVVLAIGIRRVTSDPSILILLLIFVAGSFSDPVWFHPTTLGVLIAGSTLSAVNMFQMRIPFRKNLQD